MSHSGEGGGSGQAEQGESRRELLARAALALGAGIVVMAALFASVTAVERQLTTASREADLDQLADSRTRIEAQLNQASNVSSGIAVLIEVNRGLDEARIIQVASRLLERTAVIRSIAIAPDNVIRLSIPLEGNEAAIGLDLSSHPVQSSSLRTAMQTGKPVLGGPYQLVQGGYAVIHRVPVFFDRDGDLKEDYWGVISTPIVVGKLFDLAGVTEAIAAGRLAVRGYDGSGSLGEAFLGPNALFREGGALTTPVIALDGRWQLAMRPAGLSTTTRLLVELAKAVAVLVGLLVAWLTLRWQSQQVRLVRSERLLRDVTSNVSDVVFRTDKRGRLIFLSPAYDRLTGCDGASKLGDSWLTLFAGAESQARVRQALEWNDHSARTNVGGRMVVSTRLSRCQGGGLPVELRAERVVSQRLEPGGLVGALTDLTEHQALEQLEGLATAVFEGAGDAIVILDPARRVLAVNPAFERMVGTPSSELVGERLTSPEMLDRGRDHLASCARNLRLRGRWSEEVKCRLPDGKTRVLGWSVDRVLDDRGHTHRYVCVINDVTARYRHMEAMHQRALHDGLTKVLNRTGLEERFAQARAHAIRERRPIVLAFVDLNGFKPINDTLGHHVGDAVLRETAKRLGEVGRREDIVARLGGDEFVVAFYGVRSGADMERLGESLRAQITRPILVSGTATPVRVNASIGFARFPEDADTLAGLMRRADAAMYQAKEATRDSGATMVFHAGSGPLSGSIV
ncbi:MAG: diguanylate cyclase [Halothiobacillaceae bacterium]|nr:diguanylate cyclase [Halothiobacillaceae bacterium]HER34573.1 diguanylate cyclase [Halothiobacillaceae bacterium]